LNKSTKLINELFDYYVSNYLTSYGSPYLTQTLVEYPTGSRPRAGRWAPSLGRLCFKLEHGPLCLRNWECKTENFGCTSAPTRIGTEQRSTIKTSVSLRLSMEAPRTRRVRALGMGRGSPLH